MKSEELTLEESHREAEEQFYKDYPEFKGMPPHLILVASIFCSESESEVYRLAFTYAHNRFWKVKERDPEQFEENCEEIEKCRKELEKRSRKKQKWKNPYLL